MRERSSQRARPGPGAERDRTLDVLRAIATIRVVIYHGTGDDRWSWIAAMPLMFFVGGSLYAQSLSRRPALEVLRSRLRRIVVPTFGWGVFVFVVYTATGAWGRVPWWGIAGFLLPIFPAAGAGAAHANAALDPLYWTYMGLWYLTTYIAFMMIGIPLRRFQKRHPALCIALLAAPVVLSAVTQIPELGAPTFMLIFWTLGYVYHDHRNEVPPTNRAFLLAAGFTLVGVAYAFATQPSLSMNLITVPFVLDTVGIGAVCLVVGAKPAIRRVVRVHWVDVIVSWFQQRALTIYLWHPLALGIVWWYDGRNIALRLSYLYLLILMLPMTFVLTTAMGWLEDFAAKRRIQLIPKFSGTIDLRDHDPDRAPRRILGPAIDLRTRRRARGLAGGDPLAGKDATLEGLG